MTFADRLRAAREEAGLTWAELADLAGISRAGIFKLEAGSDPKWSTVCKLADVLGVSTEYFRGNDGQQRKRKTRRSG